MVADAGIMQIVVEKREAALIVQKEAQ